MIKSIKELTDKELEIQCSKHNIECEDNRRASKIRTLASKGLRKVYVPGPSRSYSNNQIHHQTQTILKSAESINNVVFANVSEPSTSTMLCDDSNNSKKNQLTTNVVVSDAVYSHLAVQEDLRINGSIISRGQVLNPKPVCIKVLQNEASLNIDLRSNHYTFKVTESNVQVFYIDVHSLELLPIGQKGIMFFVNETTNTNVQVIFSTKFAMPLQHTIPADTKRFSFEYFLDIQNEQRFISVQFIEYTGESHGHVFSNVLLKTLADVPDNSEASGNSYLMSRKNEQGEPILYWQNLNYFDISPANNFPNSHANFQINTDDDFRLSVFENMDLAIGMHGFVSITNTHSINSLYIDYSELWRISEVVWYLQPGQTLLIEYIVIKNNLIVGRYVNKTEYNGLYNENTEEIIINVSVVNDKFVLRDAVTQEIVTSLQRNQTYVFMYTDNSFNNNPLRFSNARDGYWD